MSDTQQLFALAAVWTLISVSIARLVPKWSGRVVLFALLVGIPFWELPYGYYNFANLCETNGGLQIYETVRPQRDICAAYPFDGSAQGLLKFGFESVEAKAKDGQIIRFQAESKQAVSSYDPSKLNSEFCVSFVNNNKLSWNIVRHDFLIIRVKDEAVVARHSVFDWFGLWWQMATSPLLGRGGSCREDPVRPIMLALAKGTKEINR